MSAEIEDKILPVAPQFRIRNENIYFPTSVDSVTKVSQPNQSFTPKQLLNGQFNGTLPNIERTTGLADSDIIRNGSDEQILDMGTSIFHFPMRDKFAAFDSGLLERSRDALVRVKEDKAKQTKEENSPPANPPETPPQS